MASIFRWLNDLRVFNNTSIWILKKIGDNIPPGRISLLTIRDSEKQSFHLTISLLYFGPPVGLHSVSCQCTNCDPRITSRVVICHKFNTYQPPIVIVLVRTTLNIKPVLIVDGQAKQICSGFTGRQFQPRHRSDLAHQPHAGWLQQDISSIPMPSEVIPTATDIVHTRHWALFVPESAGIVHCTVILVAWMGPRIVVAVISGEHHIVVVPECISSVTWVPSDHYLVIGCLVEYTESAVLGIVPAEIAILQVKSQLVAAAIG